MRYRRTMLMISALLLAPVTRARAQVGAASFLNYPIMPQTLAMGETGVSVVTRNSLSIIENPAQLGVQGLTGGLELGTSLYVHDNNSSFNTLGFWKQSVFTSAVSYGVRMNSIWHGLPFKAGLGIGYSHMEYGIEPATLTVGPSGLDHETDYSNALSFGLGIDYLLRFGLGYSVKFISNKNPVSPSKLDQAADDFGAIVQIPLLHLLYGTRPGSIVDVGNIYPSLNVTAGYALRNIGGYVVQTPTYQLPLARQANLGWNWELAFRSRVAEYDWKWFSFTWSREAVNSPFSEDSTIGAIAPNASGSDTLWNYSYSYRNGLGTFSPWRDLILGRPSATTGVRKGWQIGLGGILYLREGSITDPPMPTYATFGWGARLDGVVKFLVFLHELNPGGSVTRFMLQHLDFQFNYSRAYGGILEGKPFDSLNLILR